MTKRPRADEEGANYDGSKPISLQRRRVWRACEECRRKKVKCDSREPICSQCAATNTVCKWTQTKDRAALSRHYVQELEARLLYMEQLFKQHAPDVEVFPAEGSGLPPQMAKNVPVLAPFPSAIRPQDQLLAKEDDDLDDLSHPQHEDESTLTDHFGQMALDAEGHLRWIGGSSTMTLIETFRNETANAAEELGGTPSSDQSDGPNMLYFPTGLGFGKLKALPSADEVEYPERDLADKLVEAYFERFHFLLPVLDKPSFLSRYQALMDSHGRGELPGFVAVVFAVFAVAARFLEDPRIKSEHHMDPRGTAMIFYERAMMLYIIDHTYTQFAHVQCFALLSAFLASLNRLPQAWLLVGQAVRTAQDLGLHRSPKPLKISQVDKETRRKVWWCVYGLDRCLAVQLGRPLGIDDNDVDVDLPIPHDDVDLPAYYGGKLAETSEPSLMQGFVALTSLYKIAGKVLRHVYATDKLRGDIPSDKAIELQKVVDKLDLQLTKWCDDLHPTLRQSPDSPQMVSMSAVLCSTYYAVLITLHRNFLPTRRTMMQYTGSTSVPKAVCASRSCIFLATSMNPAIPPSHHLAVFVQSLFSSAVIILLVVMHATQKAAADIAMSEVDNCVKALEILEPTWPGAKQCKELLLELAQITRANLARISKPRESRHTPRSSVQLSSPAGSDRISPLDTPPRSGPSRDRSRSRQRPGITGSVRVHPYSITASPVHSTPSPPSYVSPIKRPHEETGGRPLTIQGAIAAAQLPSNSAPRSAVSDIGSDIQGRQFTSARPQRQSYHGPSWSHPSPPTFLSNPPLFGNYSQDYASYGLQDITARNDGVNAPIFNNPASSMNWSNTDAQAAQFDSTEIPQFNGMDFIQSFVPMHQMQAEAGGSMWDGMPEVFNAEPRMFGFLEDYQETPMN